MNPALHEEVKPALPIHTGEGWITVQYENSSDLTHVNLKTLFKDAHKIKTFSLPSASATAALARVLISIGYDAYLQDASTAYWLEDKATLLKNNQGFSENWVEDYFAKWDDRFYLIHPNFPFFQDPSLYKFYSHKNFTDQPEAVQRKEWAKALSSISNLYPKAPSTAKEGGQKTTWGLPEENAYNIEDSVSNRITILMVSILHHRYSHSATNRGVRQFFNAPTHNETHHAAHAFRCATHYIPQGKSVYQTLLLSMKPYENLENDIPEWEQPVNPKTGFTQQTGFDVHYKDKVLDFDAPRSSVNMTHLALILVPEVDIEGYQLEDGGTVQQLRRLLFSFKDYKNEKGDKLPFPITWNPFTALKTETGRALKQVVGANTETAMGQTNIRKVPLLPNIEGIQTPEALTVLNDEYVLEAVPKNSQKINIYVYAGDATQDKTYADFILTENHYPAKTIEQRENIADWFRAGESIFYFLKKTYGEVKNTTGNVDSELSNSFWPKYSELFNQAVDNGFEPPTSYTKQIEDFTLNIFKTNLAAYQNNSPLKFATQLNILTGIIRKNLKKENA